MRNQRDIRKIIDEMTKTVTVEEARRLIETVDDEVLLQILKEIMEYICGIKEIKSSHNKKIAHRHVFETKDL